MADFYYYCFIIMTPLRAMMDLRNEIMVCVSARARVCDCTYTHAKLAVNNVHACVQVQINVYACFLYRGAIFSSLLVEHELLVEDLPSALRMLQVISNNGEQFLFL